MRNLNSSVGNRISAATSAIFGTPHHVFGSPEITSGEAEAVPGSPRGPRTRQHARRWLGLLAFTCLAAPRIASAQSCPVTTTSWTGWSTTSIPTCVKLGPGACCFGPNFPGQSPFFTSADLGYCFSCGGYTATVIINPLPGSGCSVQTQSIFIRPCGPDPFPRTFNEFRANGTPAKVRFRIKSEPIVGGVRGFVPGTVELFRWGLPTEQYRWRKAETNALVSNGTQPSGSFVSGATSAAMTITGIDTPDEGLYVLEAAACQGCFYSPVDAVRVYVDRPVADIVMMPQNREACLGGSTDFLVIANEPSGVPATYRWYRNGSPLNDGTLSGVGTVVGATTPMLTISNLATGAAGNYACQILTGSYVNNTFDAALTISNNTTPPVVLAPPQSVSVNAGQSAYMIADVDVATGQVPSFQWRKNGVVIYDDGRIEGTQTEQIVFNNVNASDAGSYDCIVSRGCASTTTAAATLTVNTPVICDDIDFNNNEVFPEDQDIVDYLDVLAGGECAACNDIDFNNNGVFPEDQDVIDFFNVLAGGDCP